jgi:hypothetical protein
MCNHLKYLTKQTYTELRENISYIFNNIFSISNSSNSFSIIPKSKIILPDLSPEGLQKLRNSHYIVHFD